MQFWKKTRIIPDSRKKRIRLILIVIILSLAGIFFVYTGNYYPADADAAAFLKSDDSVLVTRTDYGWFFDGPSEDAALVFYPGAKVEETAYAPLLHQLAAGGLDVCLARMPFRLSLFGKYKASDIMKQYQYPQWYVGGHSIGGWMAANYASARSESVSGVILLAAYLTKPLDAALKVITIYGTEDGVLNLHRAENIEKYARGEIARYVIEGGNHAQFGNYSKQMYDHDARITPEEQQMETVRFILDNIKNP